MDIPIHNPSAQGNTMTPATLIAQHLAALPHPDGAARQLPGFQAKLLPQPMQEQVTKTAQDIGEAIVHLLTLNGYKIVTDADLTQPVKPTQIADVFCNKCNAKVLSLNITNPTRVLTGNHFTTEKCPHA